MHTLNGGGGVDPLAAAGATPDDVYEVAGGKVRDDTALHGGYADTVGFWAGNFSAPGFGAGRITVTSRINDFYSSDGPTHPFEVFQVTANCNLVDMSTMERIKSAQLIIGREKVYPPSVPRHTGNFATGGAEARLAIPMEVIGEESRPDGRGGMTPERKLLVATMNDESAKALAGANGLVMYMQLTLDDGSFVYLNKNGVVRSNFEVPLSVLEDS